jgi:hypothetical protein
LNPKDVDATNDDYKIVLNDDSFLITQDKLEEMISEQSKSKDFKFQTKTDEFDVFNMPQDFVSSFFNQ